MATSTLYLLKYNNFYNRIVKKEDTIAGYMPYLLGEALTGVSFKRLTEYRQSKS